VKHSGHLSLLARSTHGVLFHAAITILAVGAAFSLPDAAEFVLFKWWPKIESSSGLLLATEIGFAAILVLVGNIFKLAWDWRRKASAASVAALVHARGDDGWFARRAWHRLHKAVPSPRDVCIISVTGYHTFGPENAWLQRLLSDAYEVRVLLLDPFSDGAVRRVQSLPDPEKFLERYWAETAESIAFLQRLHEAGKNVKLKFYPGLPFWKLVIVGDHAWVQYCHDGYEVKDQPEFVFALVKDQPARGLFAPFYVSFLNQWNDSKHPEYSFATGEVVYRDGKGNETERTPFSAPASQAARPERIEHAQSRDIAEVPSADMGAVLRHKRQFQEMAKGCGH
jgi:hypothetical protein